jgi:MFS family permease
MTTTKLPAWRLWCVTLGAALFFFFVFFQLAMFNSISANLMASFHMSPGQLGFMSSSYFFADALFIIPAGILLDRFSIRKISLIVMSLCVLATFVFAMTHNAYVAMLCRAITGAGNAFAFLASMQLATRWLPSKRLAFGIGLIITVIMIGGIIAQTPLTLLTSWLHWRGATLVNASVGVVFLVYMFWILADDPSHRHLRSNLSHQGLLTNLIASMRNAQNWLCATFTGLINLAISIMGELYGVMYLTQAQHLSKITATNIAGLMFIGMIVGSPLMGLISDRLARRKLPMLVGAVCILFTVLLIAYTGRHGAGVLSILFFALGFFASCQVLSYPTIAESNPGAITGTSMSIVGIMLNLLSFFAQPLFGLLMRAGPSVGAKHLVSHYGASHFAIAMLILPLAFLIALMLVFKIKETFCRPYARSMSDHVTTNSAFEDAGLRATSS